MDEGAAAGVGGSFLLGERRTWRRAKMDCPRGRYVSTEDGTPHLCALGRVKGRSLLIIKTPLIRVPSKKGVESFRNGSLKVTEMSSDEKENNPQHARTVLAKGFYYYKAHRGGVTGLSHGSCVISNREVLRANVSP